MDSIKKFVSGLLILIVAFLLLKSAKDTTAVIDGLGKGVQQVTTSLQGGRS